MRKEIVNHIYTCSILSRKNTLNHLLMIGSITPETYWLERARFSFKNGQLHHTDYELSSYDRFYKFHIKLTKPIIINKRKDGVNEYSICYCSGLVCDKCFGFESSRHSNNIDESLCEEWRAISCRKELAAFIRKSRRCAINISKRTCGKCLYAEKEEERRAEEEINKSRAKKEAEEAVVTPIDDCADDDDQYFEEPISHLYIMKDKRTGYYKIGKSKNPRHRERTLQCEMPDIEMVAVFDGMGAEERNWHEYYAKHRLRGEWFNISKFQVAFMCAKLRKIDLIHT